MSEGDYQRWVCDACGYIYDEAKGDPDSGLAPGTKYDDIPDDWYCPLCGLAKTDLRLLPEPVAVAPRKTSTTKAAGAKCKGGDDYVVIIGGGIAAWSVAEAIRQEDAEKPILMVSACTACVYPKPAISTALAQGKSADDLIEIDGESKAESLGVDLRANTRVLKIDTHKKRITTAKGGIQYGQLVLALGAEQRHLPVSGDAADQVLRVNDLISYRKFRDALDSDAKHVTILGAGLIGTEFSEDLVAGGYSVSVIDPAQSPLASLLSETTASELQQVLSEKGVDWHFTCRLDSLDVSHTRMRAVLSNGDAFETDVVVSAAGLVANTSLASKAGLQVARGICVDACMRTSAQDVFAVGDCAEVNGHIYAFIEPIRRQADVIAAILNGTEQKFEDLPPLIRVKTPSYPLTICTPNTKGGESLLTVDMGNERRDYLIDDALVGFVLSGGSAALGAQLYRKIVS